MSEPQEMTAAEAWTEEWPIRSANRLWPIAISYRQGYGAQENFHWVTAQKWPSLTVILEINPASRSVPAQYRGESDYGSLLESRFSHAVERFDGHGPARKCRP